MSRDLMDLETGKFVFRYPGEEPEPEPETPPAEPEPVKEAEPEKQPEAEEAPAEEIIETAEPDELEEDELPEKELNFGGFFRFIITLAVLAVALYGLFTYVLGGFTSYDDRMYPFINDGDLVVTFRLGDVKTGDAVLYRNPDTGNTAVSRIAAEGAETIDISGTGEVLISGAPSALTVYETTQKAHTGTMTYPYKMSSEGYFLLNDHRAVEIDSRQFGEVKREDILGRVILVIRWKGF